MPRLLTKKWSCPTCDHSASVSTERESTVDELLVLIAAAHAEAGCEPDPPADPVIMVARARRRALRLPQWSVAESMGTTQSAVSELETGLVSPNLATLRRYLAVLGLDLETREVADG